MENTSMFRLSPEGPPAEYLSAMADLEQRAWRGELTLGQVRSEIFALRERFGAEAALVMQWAAKSR
ncbi:hypothetical protein [Azohydromonas aeria]|uniref:hypothetical protein n=1 Tax=Azohydromonas aeria TaxID=2590212 RepID=UPI0012FA0D09|nr:hypothetical protein [Azohydromonas aeria]